MTDQPAPAPQTGAPTASGIPAPNFDMPIPGQPGAAPGTAAAGSPPVEVPAPSARPDKFKSDAEGWEAYKALERRVGELSAGKAPAAAPPADGAARTGTTDDQLAAYGREIDEKGDLSEDTRRSIRARGYSDSEINATMGNYKLAKRALESEAALELGGREQFQKFQEFVGANPARKTAFAGIYSADPAVRSEVAAMAKAAMGGMQGTMPTGELNSGRSAAGQGGGRPLKTFVSFQEQAKFQGHALYGDMSSEDGRVYTKWVDDSIEHTIQRHQSQRAG